MASDQKRVHPAHRYIRNSDVCVVASTQVNARAVDRHACQVQHVNHFRRVRADRLQNDVVRLIKFRQFVLDDVQQIALMSGFVRVGLFAQLAFEVLPVEGMHQVGFLLLSFLVKPLFEALVVDQAHTAATLTRGDQRVRIFFLFTKADPAQSVL